MTSSEAWDVIVIGGGHNGLVAATLLAKAGRKVLLVEADAELGGAARTEEFYPGYRVSTAHILNRLHPEVVKSLNLDIDALAPPPLTPPHKGEGGASAGASLAPPATSGDVAESPSPLWGGVRGGGGAAANESVPLVQFGSRP